MSSGRLTTHKGACRAVPRAQAPPVWATMAGKLAWVMKVVSASRGRPRSWARQGKPPPVAPERQARREGTDVASAAGVARVAAGASAGGAADAAEPGARGAGAAPAGSAARAGAAGGEEQEEAGEEGRRPGPAGRRAGGSRLPVHSCAP